MTTQTFIQILTQYALRGAAIFIAPAVIAGAFATLIFIVTYIFGTHTEVCIQGYFWVSYVFSLFGAILLLAKTYDDIQNKKGL